MLKISAILMTYERNRDLIKCIKSICNADLNGIDLTLYIFDNNSTINPYKEISDTIKNQIKYKYIRHKENIGLIKNFWFASKFVNKLNTDYITYISDDDLIYVSYFQSILKYKDYKNCVILSSCELISDRTNKITQRILPTRKDFDNNKLKALFDSRLITGFTISYKVLTDSLKNLDKIYPIYFDYWYPMTAICSFANNFVFIPYPQFLHRINNKTFWENHNTFKAFFIDRLIMYKNLNFLNSISDEEYIIIIKDFILRQNVNRFIKLFLYKDLILKKYQKKIKIFLIKYYFYYKIKIFFSKFYKFLYLFAKNKPIGIK